MAQRVLFCIMAYNGRGFLPAALESAAAMDTSEVDIDVLILDDCSPELGWSEELAALCRGHGFGCYRSPRNLGIPRNMSLGMLAASKCDYDYVVIANSDVVFPANLVAELAKVACQDRVGSVTAWSNDASIYSLPNQDANGFLANRDRVSWISRTLAGLYSGQCVDIPVGVGFCMMIPTTVVRDVGLMDPVFGRGYCEESDWTLRSARAGYRICLAPAAFVYHAGRGTNIEAGLLSEGMSSVPENEAIIDMRYPMFRDQVGAFVESGVLDSVQDSAVREIIVQAGREFGYVLDVGWLPRQPADHATLRCLLVPDGDPVLRMSYCGFEWVMELEPGLDVSVFLRELFGGEPAGINVYDRGVIAKDVVKTVGGRVVNQYRYPTKV